MQAILDSRRRRGYVQYLVAWTGYPDLIWEPAITFQFDRYDALKRAFHDRYPDKPCPYPSRRARS